MASKNAERVGSLRRTWSWLRMCCCVRSGEKGLLEEHEKINGGPQKLGLDQQEPGETETVQITVEDLGIVNGSFSMSEEEPLTRSASSVSDCLRAPQKKKLKPISSLPAVLQPELEITFINGGDDVDDEEEEELLFDNDNPTPDINLIPPTPSDVVEDDQFFDVTLEDIVADFSDTDMEEQCQEELQGVEPMEEGLTVTENKVSCDDAAEPQEDLTDEFEGEKEVVPVNKEEKKKPKPRVLRSGYLVTQLPVYTQTNDLNQTDPSLPEMLKPEFCRVRQSAKMDTFTQPRRPITRSRSFGDMLCKSPSLQMFTQIIEKPRELRSPRQRRITVGESASYMPLSTHLNGNYSEKNMKVHVSKCLREMNTEEVCQWFTSIGLQKCLPLIRAAQLCGEDMASINMNILETLQITTMEDREHLLSAIFNELDHPSNITQKINNVFGTNNGEAYTSSFTSMSKSTSSPHLSCLTRNRRSLKLKNNSQTYTVQRNSQFIEIAINVSQQIVHLRTPKETTVGKIVDSCLKMLGMTEDKSLFTVKDKEGSSEELSLDQQIGSLLKASPDNRQLELHLCKMDKPRTPQNNPETSSLNGHHEVSKHVQVNQVDKDMRIKELNQQVDSLQNVILQVQDLHQGLVTFCSELKNMEGQLDMGRLGSAELKHRLELVKGRLHDRRLSLQRLRDNINISNGFKRKQLEVRLLEKIKLNCEVFKEEISIVHLNRQLAHLQSALQESLIKEKKPRKAIRSLSQLVSPQCPAMLLVVQEKRDPDGRYGFTYRYREGIGLMVVQVGNCHLCVDDRLVEVNGVPVVNSTEEELTDLLHREPSAQIVVLRRPPAAVTSHQPPLLLTVNPDPVQTVCPEMDVVTMDTAPRRRVIAV